MKIAVISDIHSNAIALKAVLRELENVKGLEDVWCLGDIVGAGPDPSECFSLMAQYNALSLMGEYDKAVGSGRVPDSMSDTLEDVLSWTRSILSIEQLDFLSKLPEEVSDKDFTLVHGSPRLPLQEGVLTLGMARSNFQYFDTKYCLVGHTHEACMFTQTASGECRFQRLQDGKIYELGSERLIINPGSVGYPKDGDTRASYGIIDFSNMTWEHRRVEYSLADLLKQFQELNLPYEFYKRIERAE